MSISSSTDSFFGFPEDGQSPPPSPSEIIATTEIEPLTHTPDSILVESLSLEPPSHSELHRSTSAASNMSGPFMYANDLEPISDSFLSLYTDREPDSTQARLPYKPLLKFLKDSDLDAEAKSCLCDIVEMFVQISLYLFPPTYLLSEEMKRKVLKYTPWINQYLGDVENHLKRRIQKTDIARRCLPSSVPSDPEQLAKCIAQGAKIINSLYMPTGREGKIFREISDIYSSHVYQPFLQLRRTEPGHNMWELEPELAPIALTLRQIALLSDRSDNAVRTMEEEFDAMVKMSLSGSSTGDSVTDSMSSQPDRSDDGVQDETLTRRKAHQPGPSDGGTGAEPITGSKTNSPERKRHPTRLISGLVLPPNATILRPRNRDNTI